MSTETLPEAVLEQVAIEAARIVGAASFPPKTHRVATRSAGG